MSQTRTGSMIEKLSDTIFAFCLSVLFAPLFFSLNGLETEVGQNINVVLCFTLLSIIRGYIVRRFFNKLNLFNKQDLK